MQLPTLTNTRLRSPADAHAVIHAARTGILRMVDRRLDSQERADIQVGNIYVWEERGAMDLSGMGIERWTDGIRWGPSRLRNDFLFYQQRDDLPKDKQGRTHMNRRRETDISECVAGLMDEMDRMIKQTYSVHVYDGKNREDNPIKMHVTAYFNRRHVEGLRTIDAHPSLRQLALPTGMYRSARVGKAKNNDGFMDDAASVHDSQPDLTEKRRNTLPPIMVSGLCSPRSSSGSTDADLISPLSADYHGGRESPSYFGDYGSAYTPRVSHYDHAYWSHKTRGDEGSAHQALPSLRSALPASIWSPSQRYPEDDLQLSRLDVARALA